jgi:uncharacterized protein
VEILGHARSRVSVEVDTDIATLVVRLTDVAPDGAAALVTKGVLNLTHRESHSDPSPLTPGQVYEVEVMLDATSWRFEPGHAIRLSISGADFPNSWPSPKLYIGKIHAGAARASRLIPPVVPAREVPLPEPVFLPPAVEAVVESQGEPPVWHVVHDHIGDTTSVQIRTAGRTRVDDKTTVDRIGDATALVHNATPARATIRGLSQVVLHWPQRTIDARARGQIESTKDTLHVTIQLEITMDGVPHLSKQWTRSIPRRLL